MLFPDKLQQFVPLVSEGTGGKWNGFARLFHILAVCIAYLENILYNGIRKNMQKM